MTLKEGFTSLFGTGSLANYDLFKGHGDPEKALKLPVQAFPQLKLVVKEGDEEISTSDFNKRLAEAASILPEEHNSELARVLAQEVLICRRKFLENLTQSQIESDLVLPAEMRKIFEQEHRWRTRAKADLKIV